MSKKYLVGDLVETKIEKIVPGGLGLAFAEGLTLFVSLSAPGDVATVRINSIRRKTAFGEIVELRESSQHRGEPPCPYFGTCGGCDFQQLTYESQLAAKADIIRDCLTRIARLDPAPQIDVIPSPNPLAYRSRVRWHADGENLGYYKRDSHETVDIEQCPILTPSLNLALSSLRSGEIVEPGVIEAAEGENGIAIAGGGSEPLGRTLGKYRYRYSADVFFQANTLLTEELVKAAIGEASGTTALDLYCGVGLFTLPLAERFETVTAVEGNPRAARFARENVAGAGFDNVHIEAKSVEYFLRTSRSKTFDFVLLDPPRSGTEKDVVTSLIAMSPQVISYVACDPAMLARDLSHFTQAGYSIESVVALDMFPQTHHVETVVRLRRS